ncbi:hypothetical protein CyaNS01_01127 [Cyanobium sp. NS01]|nr:hypothetical protein CyaNS01_01127 [Cyanobium sp. NS01]
MAAVAAHTRSQGWRFIEASSEGRILADGRAARCHRTVLPSKASRGVDIPRNTGLKIEAKLWPSLEWLLEKISGSL